MKKNYISFFVVFSLSVLMFSCKDNKNFNGKKIVSQPSAREALLMEKSWLEYIVKVKKTTKKLSLVELNKALMPDVRILKIKLFATNQYMISLEKETKFRAVYQSLMPLNIIESIQPNFIYNKPTLDRMDLNKQVP